MDKQTKINNFKREYLEDIESINVSVDDFKKCKIPLSVLEAEVALRKVFGDEIFVPKKEKDNIAGEKEVVKLTEEDMSLDNQVREICDSIVDMDFDNNVGMVLAKLNFEDE